MNVGQVLDNLIKGGPGSGIRGHRTPKETCGLHVLRSFGISEYWLRRNGYGDRMENGTLKLAHVATALAKFGYKLEHKVKPWDKPVTLKKFMRENPTGKFFIYTSDHLMALHDGKLTDSENGSGMRRVSEAWEVK